MSRKIRVGAVSIIVLGVLIYSMLPSRLFNDPYSTILVDREGGLLSAKIASDEQWRFPELDSIPKELKTCILQFEDAYFEYHPGVNPVSMIRALWQNLTEGNVVSGGSTISMQVIRLSRKNPPRTYLEKAWEVLLALRLELSYSKTEILNMYASHAPYGGNVVGAETASWRYFNRPLHQLSWSESAMLAVLPNSPSLIHLGRNREKLKAKRDRLLLKLHQKEILDTLMYELALLEEIPGKPQPLPNHAYHALEHGRSQDLNGSRISSTIDRRLQLKLNEIINRYVSLYSQNEIHNACALVINTQTGAIKAYSGNSSVPQTRSPYVDLIRSKRSSGSILKPFLYAKAIETGLIHPTTLITDVPLVLNGFAPSNFNGEFEGVVPASSALYRSLNVPAVLLLKDYHLGAFYKDLQDLGFTTINRSLDDYGLSLILGGAEVSLWELAQVYSNQVVNLRDFEKASPKKIHLWESKDSIDLAKSISAGAWYQVSEILRRVQRPGINSDWHRYVSSRKIAWKTGTSHGFKDAWAIGYDKNHLVAVWVGNADGEGRPGLTGASAAGPVLFEIFQLLEGDSWFEKPEIDLKPIELCKASGLLPSPICPKYEAMIPFEANFTRTCKYHKGILLNAENEMVFRHCAKGPVRDTTIFQLSPSEAHYHQQRHLNHDRIPKIAESCRASITERQFEILYPNSNADLIIPKDLDGEIQQVILKAASVNPESILYWHLDDEFIGSTHEFHELSIDLKNGLHTLTVVDENGQLKTREFRAALP